MSRFHRWLRQVVLGRLVGRLQPVLFVAAWIWRRLLFRTTFIAVTGSAGKTTAKECLATVLAAAGPTFRSYRNQNALQAVSLNLLRVRPWHRFAVIELGVAGPGRMERPARLVRPDVAVIVSVCRTHANGFRDLAEHAAEKAVLLRHVRPGGVALLNDDDPLVREMAAVSAVPVVRFGCGERCDYRASDIASRWPERLSFSLETATDRRRIATQLVGEHWLPAALAALAIADRLGVDGDKAAAALAAEPPVDGRLAPYRLPNGAVFLRDDYSAAVPTVHAALRVLEQATAERRVLVITDFSDFEDGGATRRRRYLAALLPGVVDVAVFIGQKARYGANQAVRAGLAAGAAYGFSTLVEAAEFLRSELRRGDLVLLKGRTTDHIARLLFAQVGEVGCWKEYCRKRMLCDICWEMQLSPDRMRRIEPLAPPLFPAVRPARSLDG